MDVRIKLEVQKILELPNKILNIFSNYRHPKNKHPTELEFALAKYKGESLNIFYIYFGDINFEIFPHEPFKQQSI